MGRSRTPPSRNSTASRSPRARCNRRRAAAGNTIWPLLESVVSMSYSVLPGAACQASTRFLFRDYCLQPYRRNESVAGSGRGFTSLGAVVPVPARAFPDPLVLGPLFDLHRIFSGGIDAMISSIVTGRPSAKKLPKHPFSFL